MTRIVRRAYVLATLAWVVLLALAPLAATRARASTLAHAAALSVYFVGSLVCHQKPERSFVLFGARLPVCARCTGIYLGAALGLACAVRWTEARRGIAAAARLIAWPARARVDARSALVLASIPTAATLAYEWTTGVMPANAIRCVAGAPLGMVVSWLMIRLH